AKFHFVDLANRETLQPILEGCDAVIHLGEIPHQHGGHSPHQVYTSNTIVGSTVFQTCFDLKIPRVLYASSCQAYGLWADQPYELDQSVVKYPIDETLPLRPMNTYGLSKQTNERYAEFLSKLGEFSVAVFRLPAVWNAWSSEMWVRRIKRDAELWKHHNDGFWTWVHIDDVVNAFALAIEKPRAGFQAYHLFAEDVFGDVPIHERLKQVTPKNWPPLPSDWPSHKAPVSTKKAFEHFGWQPKVNWKDLSERFPA
ncbi:MAG TPA: NAD(P)-dependent oxidoreductase, partial [Tepidisphaeraceae bacterium]|nr:NAD(P)-dependent oxidoreductase [Tepidisphaeraceae bacterium]